MKCILSMHISKLASRQNWTVQMAMVDIISILLKSCFTSWTIKMIGEDGNYNLIRASKQLEKCIQWSSLLLSCVQFSG